MTVLAVDPLVTYTYTGAATFSYSFKCFEDDEIQVTYITGGVRTLKTLTTDYTVSKNSDYQGGTITTSFAGTGFIEIRLNSPFEQDVALVSGGPLVLATLERMMDKIVGRLQMLNYVVENEIDIPTFKGYWATGTAYSVSDLVIGDGGDDLYHCKVAHTAGTFATDISTGKWEVVLSESLIGVSVGFPAITGGDAKKAIRVNSTETAYEFAHIVPKPVAGLAGQLPIINIAENEYEGIDPPEKPNPRATFEYSSSTDVLIKGYAKYWSDGKGWLYIDSASGVTKTLSNISGTDYWHYLYLDYSAITQRHLNAAGYFIDSTTAPTYDLSKKGWYNGNDRLIMAFWIDSSGNLDKFYHNGDEFVIRDAAINERAYAAMTATWVTVSLAKTIPPFAKEGQFVFFMSDSTNTSVMYMRPLGSAAATGIRIGRTVVTSDWDNSYVRTYVGTSQSVEMKATGGTTTSMELDGVGFYLPQQV